MKFGFTEELGIMPVVFVYMISSLAYSFFIIAIGDIDYHSVTISSFSRLEFECFQTTDN